MVVFFFFCCLDFGPSVVVGCRYPGKRDWQLPKPVCVEETQLRIDKMGTGWPALPPAVCCGAIVGMAGSWGRKMGQAAWSDDESDIPCSSVILPNKREDELGFPHHCGSPSVSLETCHWSLDCFPPREFHCPLPGPSRSMSTFSNPPTRKGDRSYGACQRGSGLAAAELRASLGSPIAAPHPPCQTQEPGKTLLAMWRAGSIVILPPPSIRVSAVLWDCGERGRKMNELPKRERPRCVGACVLCLGGLDRK